MPPKTKATLAGGPWVAPTRRNSRSFLLLGGARGGLGVVFLADHVGLAAGTLLNFVGLLSHGSDLLSRMFLLLGGKMKERRGSFNLFLGLATLVLCWGVHGATPEEKQREKELEQKKKLEAKQMAQIRVYREVTDFSGRASELGTLGVNKATVGRTDPVEMTVQRDAVLDERDVKRATLVEQRDQSYSIAVEFVQRGSMVLHMNSVAAKGQRLVIAARWSDGTNVFNRWIAAPLQRRALDQGIIVFTPDMSREESAIFVRGLNNVAIKLKNQAKPAKEKKTPPAATGSTNAVPGSKTPKPKDSKADAKLKNEFDPFQGQ